MEDLTYGRGRTSKPSVKCQSTGAGGVQAETRDRRPGGRGGAEAGAEEPNVRRTGGGAEPDLGISISLGTGLGICIFNKSSEYF